MTRDISDLGLTYIAPNAFTGNINLQTMLVAAYALTLCFSQRD